MGSSVAEGLRSRSVGTGFALEMSPTYSLQGSEAGLGAWLFTQFSKRLAAEAREIWAGLPLLRTHLKMCARQGSPE